MSKSYSKIKKIQQRNEEPANATGALVVGTGNDSSVVKKKKKKKSPWNKYSPDALGRQFRMEEKKKKKKLKSTRACGEKPDKELEFWKEEETVAVATEPNITPDDKFAGVDVFKVDDNEYNNCKMGKKKYARWDKYVDVETDTGKKIVGYAKKYPNKSIIVQHDKTDHMLYLKKFVKGEE